MVEVLIAKCKPKQDCGESLIVIIEQLVKKLDWLVVLVASEGDSNNNINSRSN